MANRNVFKILSSIGPGGCIVNFCEKICRNYFYEAYEQGDPREEPSQKYAKKAQEMREAFVHELFEKRGHIERNLDSLSEENHKQAYEDLSKIIHKHKLMIAKAEISRLARERLFFEPESR